MANSKAIKTNYEKVMHRLIHRYDARCSHLMKAFEAQFLMKITWL